MKRARRGRALAASLLAGRLPASLKKRPLTGKDLERMKLIEQAVTCFEAARLT